MIIIAMQFLIAVLMVACMTQAQEFPIFGLQFSPDGKYLAAASNSNEPPGPIVIWNVSDWSVHQIHRPTKGSLDVDFSPDGSRLAFGTKAGIVGVLEVATGKPVRESNAHSNAVYSVAYSPDGNSLASGGADRLIKMWNVTTGELLRTFEGHRDTVDAVAISPNGKLLLSGGNDSEARLWDIASGQVTKKFTPSELIVRRVDFSDDGNYFLVSSWDGKARIRETDGGHLRAVLPSGSDCADMTRDNRFVVTSGHSSTAMVYAVNLHDATADEQSRIRELIAQLKDESYEVRETAEREISRIGMIAEPQLQQAIDDEDAEIRVRARRLREKVLSPEPIARLAGHRGDVEVVCFSPDGRLIATACRGGDIKIWDASNYSEITWLAVPTTDDTATKLP
jgi:WD40 repeat protein